MSEEREISKEEIRDMSEKEFRKEFPSGWMELSRYETLVLIIDSLLESSPSREYTHKELADQSGTSEKSVEDRIDSLVRLGVIQELEDREPIRYSLNDKSPITQKLYELNLTVQKVKDGELPLTISRDDKGSIQEPEEKWNPVSEDRLKSKPQFKIGENVDTDSSNKHNRQIKPGKAAIGAD